jgi:hypothetical protein
MYRPVGISLAFLVVTVGFCRLNAKVIPYRKLSMDQRLTLEQSERRLETYDRALQVLERDWRKGRVSRTEYGYEEHDLTGYICAEARFQNDILISNGPCPPEDVREVMENIEKYATYAGAGILYVGVRLLPALTP